ncbi:unnamed protein product [Caenorhabditis bovis]|uniref:Uncharacterized protein n=1 Tax=Caenorhabditis bovis TaxID=2654633 RepID=A0A8S1EDG8_9PELO|nr:unnamed protein product [Caenorhabditis bovis]
MTVPDDTNSEFAGRFPLIADVASFEPIVNNSENAVVVDIELAHSFPEKAALNHIELADNYPDHHAGNHVERADNFAKQFGVNHIEIADNDPERPAHIEFVDNHVENGVRNNAENFDYSSGARGNTENAADNSAKGNQRRAIVIRRITMSRYKDRKFYILRSAVLPHCKKLCRMLIPFESGSPSYVVKSTNANKRIRSHRKKTMGCFKKQIVDTRRAKFNTAGRPFLYIPRSNGLLFKMLCGQKN